MINNRGGSTYYNNSWTMQVLNITEFVEFIYNKYPEANIIELGTAYGGLTNLLCDFYGKIRSYDKDTIAVSYSKHAEQSFLIGDVHDDLFLEEHFKSNLEEEKITIFFIDGGDKALEFNKVKKYAKPGDILMVHDYMINQEDFETRGKDVWNHFEVGEDDLDLEGITRAPFFDKGISYAWGAYQKQ